ncbi:MAG: hypothetical protein DSM106950_42275 [Stigonema ocellatum SAG 48.90 = DSM 106950]|nr:hypothetical protein [Stigonema ocellatum SAG 48.90 = DSM 106950]
MIFTIHILIQQRRILNCFVTQERVPGLQAVQQHSKLMVLGKPGAGKTTFLKYRAIITEERQRAEGSYAEGKRFECLPDAIGSEAPNFSYEKQKNMYFDRRVHKKYCVQE